MPEKNNSNELKLSRVYDAPVAAVWEAWTDPAQTALWWGPRDFTLTTHSKDLRPGGTWNYTMHGPEGTDYPNITQYHEVEKNKKLVYDHGGNENQPPMFRVTVLFSEEKGKTKMDMTMTFTSPEKARETNAFIKKAGGNATWDRLAEHLEQQISHKEKFVINRSFNAPLETMFKMWTDPQHFSKWLPPTGFEMEFIRCDIKTGGSSFYVMTGNGGMKIYGRAEYRVIQKPDLLIYAQQFCDENENIARHPMSSTWPETMMTTVQLTAEGPDQTRVTVTWEPAEGSAVEEIETFVKAKGGMTQGWTGSFDQLEEHLESEALAKIPAL